MKPGLACIVCHERIRFPGKRGNCRVCYGVNRKKMKAGVVTEAQADTAAKAAGDASVIVAPALPAMGRNEGFLRR